MKKLILMSAFVLSLVFAGIAQTPQTKKETSTTTTKEVTTPVTKTDGKKANGKKLHAKKSHAKKVESKKVETTTTTKPAVTPAPMKK